MRALETSPAKTAPTTVFICSAGHSGSTLLDLLLGSHPAAMSLGEITQLPKNVALNTPCSCGTPVRVCELWRPVLDRLAAEPVFGDWRADPYSLFLGYFHASTVVDGQHQTALRQLQRRLVYAGAYAHWRWRLGALAPFTYPLQRGASNKQVLYRVVAELAGKELLIDSSKHYLEAITLYRTAPAQMRVVLLVRDGRAVYYSYLKRGWTRRDALNAWLYTYARGLGLLRKQIAPEHLLEVRYEQLATQPARELHRICDAVGVAFDPRMLEFRAETHHVLNGNDMRFSAQGGVRFDEAWRRKLSAEDLRYFEARAGKLNRNLGYGD